LPLFVQLYDHKALRKHTHSACFEIITSDALINSPCEVWISITINPVLLQNLICKVIIWLFSLWPIHNLNVYAQTI